MTETFHSRVVAGLKVLLPLTALGLLSTVFLLSRTANDEPDLTFFADASEIPERDSVTRPYYTGSTPEGHAVSVTAESAQPQPEDPAGVLAEHLSAAFRLTDGTRINILADSATVNEPADRMALQGGVVIDSSTGYRLETAELHSALRSVHADAPQGVTGTSPIGDLSAGALRIRDGGGEGQVQMFFTKGVKLVYQPARQPAQEGDTP
ncbi:hypothetical protein [Marinovum sp.]|uniref:hypothetical protein n=1 Tax=Marinovum sp. TaxID=2024839 RepID=UPI002B264CAC|nr:hypothetical protein [Marinovum sp.]